MNTVFIIFDSFTEKLPWRYRSKLAASSMIVSFIVRVVELLVRCEFVDLLILSLVGEETSEEVVKEASHNAACSSADEVVR